LAYDRSLAFEYNNPTKIIFGENSLKELGPEVDRLGCAKALIVTDKGITKAGLVAKAKDALDYRYAGVYDHCVQDSDFHLVNEGAAYALEIGADILISVGGGSVIDTAKGMAVVMKEGGKLQDYDGIQMLSRPQTPHLVVPTTAGTGSEVTWAAVIKDRDRNIKMLICDYHIIPNTAILDPLMVAGLSMELTASTGMDALTHAIEAVHASESQPVSDAMAFQSIRMITEYLPQCIKDGSDLYARGQQQLAATMAGIAFSNAQVGLVHAMSHSLGAIFGVPHGLANSILLPHVMLYNLEECAPRYKSIALAMGLPVNQISDAEAGKAAAEAVWKLTRELKIPQKLSETGITEEGLLEAATLAMSDGTILYNPRMVTDEKELMELFQAAW